MKEDTHLLLIPKMAKIQKKILATQMKHDQSSYFCRGPDDFCWGPAPVGPTLVKGLVACTVNCVAQCVCMRTVAIFVSNNFHIVVSIIIIIISITHTMIITTR